MKGRLSVLGGNTYDAIIIGGGANGAGVAQNLAAAGYSVLLVEKYDFASGTSSRSSRVLNCGLAYLVPDNSSFVQLAKQPRRLVASLKEAARMMRGRSDIARSAPSRVKATTACYPIYSDGRYSGWQVDLAFKLLWLLGPKNVSLNYRRLSAAEARKQPLLASLRDQDRLVSVATYTEYVLSWPERIIVDSLLDAESSGAHIRNYTEVSEIRRAPGEWQLTLLDRTNEGDVADVSGRMILNLAGAWLDDVNRLAERNAPRRVQGNKGVHIMLKLPVAYSDLALVTTSRSGQPFTVLPINGMHCAGTTWTRYDGRPEEALPEEEDIRWLLDELSHLLPALRLDRSNVVFAFAGVRAFNYDPASVTGRRGQEFSGMSEDGRGDYIAMTGGPITTYRETAKLLARMVQQRLQAGPASKGSNSVSPRGERGSHKELGTRSVSEIIDKEHVLTLQDMMFRRHEYGWSSTMGIEELDRVVCEMSGAAGWDKSRAKREADAYREYLRRHHCFEPDVVSTRLAVEAS